MLVIYMIFKCVTRVPQGKRNECGPIRLGLCWKRDGFPFPWWIRVCFLETVHEHFSIPLLKVHPTDYMLYNYYIVVAQDSHLFGPLSHSLWPPSPWTRLQQLDGNLEGKLLENTHEPLGSDVTVMDSRSQSHDFTVLWLQSFTIDKLNRVEFC